MENIYGNYYYESCEEVYLNNVCGFMFKCYHLDKEQNAFFFEEYVFIQAETEEQAEKKLRFYDF